MKRSQKKGVRMAALALAAAFVLVLAAPASAGDEAARGAGARGAASGLQAAVDPANGKLRQPTPAESRALLTQARIMTKSDTSGLQITTWPDGTIGAELTPDYLNVWLAQLGGDNSLYQVCVDGANAGAANPTPAFEEK